MKHLYVIILLCATSLCHRANASHLVGGEITYQCLGNNQYRITLRVYRDCISSTNAQLDANVAITIFNSSGSIVQNLTAPRGNIFRLPTTVNNPCLQAPPNLCTEYADYSVTTNLPPNAGGYTITHQRCCRNATIDNVPNSGTWGNTYTIQIPGSAACNSSPTFRSSPPIVMCLNDSLNIDSSVLEADGDSLVYELCEPLHGGGQNQTTSGCPTCAAPNPAVPPPYTNVPFVPGRSATNPMPGNPSVNIDPQTGLITGLPTTVGQFVFAICVSEYRNGILLSTVRRDYQFNVVNCQSNVTARVRNQISIPGSLCSGRTIQFEDNSINATTYFWDFGDPSTLGDTSSLQNPTYTYADTGTYSVMLIVNRGWPCSDTTTIEFDVNYPLSFSVDKDGGNCFDMQNFNFEAIGTFSTNAQFNWTFPQEANIQSSQLTHPPPISFNAPGSYLVELTVVDFGCTFTYSYPVEVYTRPEFYADPPQGRVCIPYVLDLNHSAVSPDATVHYEWNFGDGTTSSQANPNFIYTQSGTYNGSLLMYTTAGCRDSAYYTWQIVVQNSPEVFINLSRSGTDIFEPTVEIWITGIEAGDNYTLNTGDGNSFSNQSYIFHKYQDTGTYLVTLDVVNVLGCSTHKMIPFRVAPVPMIYVPSAFSPNADRINDRFRSFSSGYSEFYFRVFDRWGNVVFEARDSNIWWDGTVHNNGASCPQGAYTWSLYFRSTEGEVFEDKGIVVLFR